MKSTNKIVYLLLTSIFIFTSCGEKQKSKNQNVESQDVESQDVANQNMEKLKGTISYKRAKILQQEYIKTRAVFINEYLDKVNHLKKEGLVEKNKKIKDVRDVTFDLETLKQYIAYVEKEAKSKGLKGLGLRVYLGAYPKGDTSVKDPGFTTVFFMPTHQPAAETTKENNFFYWFEDEIIDGAYGLNYGSAGRPPHVNDL